MGHRFRNDPDHTDRTHQGNLLGRVQPRRPHVATGSFDSTACLWNVASGKPLITLLGPPETVEVYGLAFSPDSRTLATGNSDSTVRLWSTTLPRPDAAVADICRTVGRDLTPQERTAYMPGQSNDPVCPTD